MNLLKKCLIDFNNQWTNKITEKEVDDDDQLRFTLLDMQKFAKKYVEAINVIPCCAELKEKEEITFDKWLKMWNWEQVGNSYIFKRGESYTDVESLMISYKKEHNL